MRSHIVSFLILLTIPIGAAAQAPPPLRAPVRRAPSTSLKINPNLGNAKRVAKDGWLYVRIEGEPNARGFQYGYLCARDIGWALNVRRVEWEHDSGMEWTWLVTKSNEMILPKLDPELLEEMNGMVSGMHAAGEATTLGEMVAYNAYLELAWYWWPQEKKKYDNSSPNPPRQACSSFIATGRMTADHGIVLGHNTMFEYPALPNIILDLVPKEGHRILMQTFPGWIHSGTDFFITDGGLVGSETTIGGFEGFDEKGIPEFIRMRRATQDSSSITGWVSIMTKGNNGGYANAWLIGDVNTNEIARLELGLKNHSLERTKDGYFTGSNVAENTKILRQETDLKDGDIRLSSVARRVRWKMLMRDNAGKIDVAKAKAFEADHYDAMLNRDNPGGRTLCGHGDIEGPMYAGNGTPFFPGGTIDGKVVDSKMAKAMSFEARWGSACGRPFDAGAFLAAHPQFDWMREILANRISYPWTTFKAGM
jgi:hypothetical protein